MRISDWSSDVCSSDLLDRRVLQAAVARNSKFIDDAGQSALFFGCRKGSADPEDSRRQRRDEQQANFPFVHVWHHWRSGVGLDLFSKALPDSSSGSVVARSEEHTSELQSLMRISYAVFCLKKNTIIYKHLILNLFTDTTCT